MGRKKYVKEILKTLGIEEKNLLGTLMVIGCKLSKEDERLEVNETLYQSMIGKLQHVVHTRPYIAQMIGIETKFFSKPDTYIMLLR